MEAEVKKNSLKSRIIKTEPIDWRALRFIQQDKFKDLDLSARHRLKSSLVANNFSQPFYVWEDEDNGVIYCLDGKHRTALLEELIAEGYDDSFACFVVGEVRDKKTGYYRKLINETVNAFERAGATFYNELILVNVAGSLPIRAASTFKSRKIGKCHQNVLVFYKGDVSKIKSKFPDSDFSIAGPDFISENQ